MHRQADAPEGGQGYERSWLERQVYINPGWSKMTTTQKNVNEDTWERGKERVSTHTHGVQKSPALGDPACTMFH